MTEEDQVCRAALLKHWTEAQIDVPVQTLSRYDDVAKLLITIGGFVLGVLAAMLKETARLEPYKLAMIMVPICSFLVCSVLVCFRQPKIRTGDILKQSDDNLLKPNGVIEQWCKDVDGVRKWKRGLLIAATILFALSFVIIMGILLTR